MQHLFEQVSTTPQLHHATPTLVLQCAFVMMILIYIYYSPPFRPLSPPRPFISTSRPPDHGQQTVKEQAKRTRAPKRSRSYRLLDLSSHGQLKYYSTGI